MMAPVIIVLRKLGNVNVQGMHPMRVYILRSPSNEELEALKAQLMARRVTTKEVAVEGPPISRRELLMGRVTKVIEKNIPTYFENACRARFGCNECVNTCPANAISMVNNRVTINESACIECGLCVSKCPTGALAMVGADDNEYVALLNKLNSIKGIKRVTFTCPLNTRGGLRMVSTSIGCRVSMQSVPSGWQWRLPSHLRWVLSALTSHVG